MATLSQHYPSSVSAKGSDAALKGKGKAAAAVAVAPSADADEQAQAELTAFDLDSRFGPCTGITRLQRYERACSNAAQHGAPAPPPQLKALLYGARNEDGRFTNNVWQGRV